MLEFRSLGLRRVKWHLSMRGWHGTMNRVSTEQVISVALAHSLHLHDVCWTWLVKPQ